MSNLNAKKVMHYLKLITIVSRNVIGNKKETHRYIPYYTAIFPNLFSNMQKKTMEKIKQKFIISAS